MPSDVVEKVLRAWALWSPLLPVGFADRMKIKRVREGEMRRATERVAVDVAPLHRPGPEDYSRCVVHYDPEPGTQGGLPASVLRTAVGKPVHHFEETVDPAAAPPSFHYLVRLVAERYRLYIEGENRPHRVAGRTVDLESIPLALVTVEFGDNDYEFAIVGENGIVHVERPPRAWLRIALMAGLIVAGLVLAAARLLPGPEELEWEPVSTGPPAKSAPAERMPAGMALCPRCLGEGCGNCRQTGRLTFRLVRCEDCKGTGKVSIGSAKRTCTPCRGKGELQRFR